ncbi:MAG TPA: chemotaxis protein CheW [Polyangiaceae bacterium]|jgi:purine-binding chemotaxis protein CheW
MTALHVVFKVAEAEYALAAADVLQMESYQGATPVPGALPYVAGVVQVRGRVVPIVDLRVRFGLPSATPTLDSRIVVVELQDRTVGLLVDSAREIIKLAPEQIAPPPRVMDGADGFVKAVAHLGKRLLLLIDFVKVIGEESDHGN